MRAQLLVQRSDRSQSEAVRAVVSDNRQPEVSDYFDLALVRLGIEDKEVSAWWACSESFVSAIRRNEKPLPESRIAQLPHYVQIALLTEWARDLGVLVGEKAALLRVLEGLVSLVSDEDARLEIKPRMTKAEL